MPRQSNSLEWYKKAEVDYFSAFMKLWLSFNALYSRMFQGSNFGSNDRKYIEELKNSNNFLKTKFRSLFDEELSEGKEFKVYLIELMRKYDGGLFGGKRISKNERLKPQMNGNPLEEISFKEFIHSRSFQLKRTPIGYTKINEMYIRNNADEIWTYYIEVIYMIRNLLIHGGMDPTEENHKIIRICYHTLNILIEDNV